jgi:serine/threonine protein kinase
MSGISKSFKLPTLNLTKRRKITHGLPTFKWEDVKDLQPLGVGSFGSVYCANCLFGDEDRKVVVKRLRGESMETRSRFIKEAEILHSINHANFPEFYGFSDDPYGLMMEYAAFDFKPFDVEKTVSNLEDFYTFIDSEFNFTSFSDVIPVCLRDVVNALKVLHDMDITHRDLKPSNVLVSNQHYCHMSSFSSEYERNPIICKVADFGLSRSLETQTRSIIQSRTNDICRGTPVYMAPEIHNRKLQQASITDLKKTDVWSLGLLSFSVINPNLSSPYRKVIEELGVDFSLDTMKEIMTDEKLPVHDNKYESIRVAEWWQAEELFSRCCRFDPELRPSIEELIPIVNINDPEASLDITQLSVSQSSALEIADELISQQAVINAGQDLAHENRPENDGTNACTFLALAICDSLFATLRGEYSQSCQSWSEIARLADHIIEEFPTKINQLRNASETYELSEAKVMLESNNLLSKKYQLTEECVSGCGYLTEIGRNELCSALSCHSSGTDMKFGVYTCPPYTLLIGVYNNSIFLLDTHPIGQELGGTGNGIVVSTKDKSILSCRKITQWLLKRLKVSGVDDRTPQSLAWLIEDHSNGMNKDILLLSIYGNVSTCVLLCHVINVTVTVSHPFFNK